MSSSTAKVQRSWTANEDPKPKKWLAVVFFSFLLVVAVVAFLVFTPWKARPVTFVAELAVSEYSETILPQPAYPTWDLEQLSDSMPERGLESWSVSTEGEVSGRNDLIQRLGTLSNKLKDLKKSDTVVVYLRGHAINHHGKAYLLTGEFVRNNLFTKAEDAKGELMGAVSLESIFRDLQKVRASQIVLLADICDLPTVPTLGIIANDVPELIGQELSRVTKGPQLWVITAAASLQPSHSSNLKKRTLLQSASEYALNSRHCENGDNFLSLAVYYQAILRYSHSVTEGQQTPLLFRSGSSTSLTNPSSSDWKDARKVSFARLDSNLKELSKKAEDATKTASKTSSSVTLVSMQDSSSKAASEPKDAALGTVAKKEEKTKAPETPSKKYWRLREQFWSRKDQVSPRGWAPVDFAAEEWLASGLKAASLERLVRIGDTQQEKKIEEMVKDLVELKDAIKSLPPTGNYRSSLAQAWQAASTKMMPESDKRTWHFAEDLPDSQHQDWIQTRAGYRDYFDAMGQLSGWLSAALNDRGQNRTELTQLVGKLVSALADLQNDLPKASDALLDKRLPDNKVAAIRSSMEKLKEFRTQQTDALLTKLNTEKFKSKLNWADERSVEQLLQDTNLGFSDRDGITSAWLTVEQLNEPGTANNDDKTQSWSSLLNSSEARATLNHFAAWCSLYNSALKLASAGGFKEPGSTSDDLNSWGRELIAQFNGAPAERDPLMCWKQACLNELRLFKTGNSDNQSGMLLSVSKDTNIVFSVLPSPIQLSSSDSRTLTCNVKRHNGTKITDCWLTWELIDPEKYQGNRLSLLSVKELQGVELAPEEPHPVKVRGGNVELMLSSSVDSKKFRQSLKIRVGVSSEEAKLPNGQEVQVLLPNPDRFELYAKCLNPAKGDSEIIKSKINKFDTVVLSGLSVPAINGQAKSRYELYLVNRTDEPKTIRAKLYAVAGAVGQANGNGSIPPRPPQPKQTDTPLFETTSPIELPKNTGLANPDGSPAGGFRIALGAVPNATGVKPITQNAGEFGLVLAIEEIEIVDNQPRSLNREKTYQWIDCTYTNPFGKLVVIKPRATKGAFDFQVEVPKESWTRWGLEELEIKAHLTDARGEDIESSTPSSSLRLNPDKPDERLLIRPKQIPNDGKPVLHIDIGGYPRAIAFDSSLKGESDETRNASQAFVRLKPMGALFTSTGKDPVLALQWDANTLIIPAHKPTEVGPIGEEVSITKFSMPFHLDFPDVGPKSAEFTLDRGNQKQVYHYDRQFIPMFEIEEGNLVFSATVQDLRAEFQIANAGFLGKVTAQATIAESANTETSHSCALVFDRTPPQIAKVVCSDSDLYSEGVLELSLAATDTETPVKEVYFAIDQDGRNEGKFDERDLKIPNKAILIGDTWTAKLEAKLLSNLPLTGYRVVARSIDQAENVQDENTSTEISWRGERKAQKPASKPPAKKKVVAAPPKKSEPQNVTIQVTVDGKAPTLLGNIQVKGLSGEAEIKNGTATTFTKVAEGSYDVTATYKDTFGKAFEGTLKVTVSGDSAVVRKIDAKPVK